VLGHSDAFLDFRERLARVAPVERPVLVAGERGTGKELAAVRLHYLSRRWQEPLVTLNCAALNPTLIESELFGFEKGAFTGAYQRRAGRFEAAHGGTLFLDEIGNIPLETQEKILRVVEYGVFERVGSPEPVETDVRIVAATNADLPALSADGRFKRDLLDRLSFEVLTVPPLRERFGDVELLAEHFARRMALELGWEELPRFGPEALAALEAHTWPGNVRELKNVVERAVYRSESATIEQVVFDPFQNAGKPEAAPVVFVSRSEAPEPLAAGSTSPEGMEWTPRQPDTTPAFSESGAESPKSFKEAVRELEIGYLDWALRRTRYNQKQAARLLGLTYHQFRNAYRKHRDSLRPPPDRKA
jgi:psp operon transcriptional activator